MFRGNPYEQREYQGYYGQQYQQNYDPRAVYNAPSVPPPPPGAYYNQYDTPAVNPNSRPSQYGGYDSSGPSLNPQAGHIDIADANSGGYAPPSAPPPNTASNSYGNTAYQGPSLPPSNPISYSAEGQGHNYQYSTCQGKRKALLIGINYKGTNSQLNGCINDVHSMSQLLIQRYGYKEDDMVIMTEEGNHPRSIPTRQNMIDAMHWLVSGAQPNDALFFHYSGHGGQTKDLDGDEVDGYDEVIYPLDYEKAGHIVDDEMHDIMVKPLPIGCRLTAVFDSCHSGGALDLPFMYSTKGVLKEPSMLEEAGMGLLNAGLSLMDDDFDGMIDGITSAITTATSGNSDALEYSRKTKYSPADVISISGCKDSQTSADTSVNGFATGALSYALRQVLTQYPQLTYLQLLQQVREALRGKYTQRPQLSCSHPLDVNLAFVM
ncbi:metacaspase Pca1 [Schizosaccharomyces japonicus yFS275]|uniref:Metacaspase Pca1 n=1 Tax=Schizosaccharomyces japonicus (strain yFS275 / FY16936) TaxID=402676 RepID=B6JXJ3_SCHJY|nr:metacaspase Pca1 [Schizosaccharomyces japonicus yFS275]EEB05137.2 metacaspase Pca1 [Schizosaccharomyces japonicus yFS275]